MLRKASKLRGKTLIKAYKTFLSSFKVAWSPVETNAFFKIFLLRSGSESSVPPLCNGVVFTSGGVGQQALQVVLLVFADYWLSFLQCILRWQVKKVALNILEILSPQKKELFLIGLHWNSTLWSSNSWCLLLFMCFIHDIWDRCSVLVVLLERGTNFNKIP